MHSTEIVVRKVERQHHRQLAHFFEEALLKRVILRIPILILRFHSFNV